MPGQSLTRIGIAKPSPPPASAAQSPNLVQKARKFNAAWSHLVPSGPIRAGIDDDDDDDSDSDVAVVDMTMNVDVEFVESCGSLGSSRLSRWACPHLSMHHMLSVRWSPQKVAAKQAKSLERPIQPNAFKAVRPET
jgi:hypothetical protein